jgi:hypothetical protein
MQQLLSTHLFMKIISKSQTLRFIHLLNIRSILNTDHFRFKTTFLIQYIQLHILTRTGRLIRIIQIIIQIIFNSAMRHILE